MKLILNRKNQKESDLLALATSVIKEIDKPAILLLSGDVGAGKTTFVSFFCKTFSIESVQSPTYSVHHRYSSPEVIIDHFDLYRLETEEEVESSGFYDLLADKADYKIIEWPDRIEFENYPLDKKIYILKLNINSDGTRSFEFSSLV
jgi:tRNA threonylcarbamoyladenosine biosynthesis protein TsaE